MTKWKAKYDSHGFLGRYWKEGEIVELEDGIVPNQHFDKLDPNAPVAAVVEVPQDPATMSELQKLRDSQKPTTGMAIKAEEKTSKAKKK